MDGARLTVSLVSSLYAKLTTCYQFAVQSSNQTKPNHCYTHERSGNLDELQFLKNKVVINVTDSFITFHTINAFIAP